jgi:type IV pilus assembly protein PilC
MRVEMPFTTRMLIKFGNFIGKNGSWAVPLILIFFLSIMYIMFVNGKTKVIGQRMILHTPGFKRVIFEAELARFGYLLGTLLGAGLPILDSMEALKESSTYLDYRRLYAHLQYNVEMGFTFEEGFNSFKDSEFLIPASVQQIITTGEKTGNMALALKNVGIVYEKKIENTTKNLSTILEPVMLLVIFSFVMFLALAVIQPVYGLLSGVK